jgi:hypothetical protein
MGDKKTYKHMGTVTVEGVEFERALTARQEPLYLLQTAGAVRYEVWRPRFAAYWSAYRFEGDQVDLLNSKVVHLDGSEEVDSLWDCTDLGSVDPPGQLLAGVARLALALTETGRV